MRDSGRELLRTALDTLNAPEAQHAQETHDASRDELVRSAEAGDEAALKALADSLTRDEAASLLEEIDAGERIAKQQALAALTPKHETAAALAKAAPAERQQLAELARSTERDSS